MKNLKSKFFIILFSLFIVSTVMIGYILFKDIYFPFVTQFIIGYVIFLFLLTCYFIIVTFINLKTENWATIRKRGRKFITHFIILSGINYLVFYAFNSSEVDFYKIFATPLGVAIAFAFSDLMFKKRDQKV